MKEEKNKKQNEQKIKNKNEITNENINKKEIKKGSKDKKLKEKKPKETKTSRVKRKQKSKLYRILVNVFELLFLVALIVVILYLVKSENGLLTRMSQKNASEKISAAIKEYSAAKEENPDAEIDIEEYLRKIEGLDDIVVNDEAGTIELKIDGQGFFLFLNGEQAAQYDSTNGRIIDGIYVVEEQAEDENQEGEGSEGQKEGENQENQEEQNNNENSENNNEQNNEQNQGENPENEQNSEEQNTQNGEKTEDEQNQENQE